MSFVVVTIFISLCMAVISLLLTKRRILSAGSGFLWLLFWCTLGILSVQRDPLKVLMSFVSFVNFTNFLLTFSSFFLLVLIFYLYINQRKHRKVIEKLAQEIALIQFFKTSQEKDLKN